MATVADGAGQIHVPGTEAISWIASDGFHGMLCGVAMHWLASSTWRSDGQLWLVALGLSMLTNTAILATVGFVTLKSLQMREPSVPVSEPAPAVVLIYPEVAQGSAIAATVPAKEAAPAPAFISPAAGQRFARTAEDQTALRPDVPTFMGERNTRATSDRPPEPTAPPLPSQAGIPARHAMDIETTESDYQDGTLASAKTATPAPAPAPAPASTPPAADPPAPAPPPARAQLLDGPQPVDVPVARENAGKDAIKPTSGERQVADAPPVPSTGQPETTAAPRPSPNREPGFRGFQRKTAVTGSISRTGRSSLDVEDSPLGRYQAALSRAVEQEWQRNCVRHRDFITPGFLTVRFFVAPNGKVRSVRFVGDMETGEVQKGFTLNSIRDAEIPPMPATLRKQYDKEPLELIFRFYF